MDRINELYVERASRILAVGILSRIVLDAFSIAVNTPESEFGKLFTQMSSLLPDHYLTGRSIQVPGYKAVSFVDSQSLILIVSEAEAFFQDSMIEVICKYPEKIGALGSSEPDIRFAAQKYINKLLRKAPNEYKTELITFISAPEYLLDDLWPHYVEAKARRDIGVHNSWVVNGTYRRKVMEVGLEEPTETELSVDAAYFLRTRDAVITLMDRIRVHCETALA